MSHLAKHFKSVRLDKALTLGNLARLIGYANLNKGANRITRFEQCGDIKEDLLMKLADALEIDWEIVEELVEQDYRQFLDDWNAWANEPCKPHLVIRLIPGWYAHQDLPASVETPEEAEAFASARAKQIDKRCCLVLSRRISIWFDACGGIESITEATPGQPNSPFMMLRKSNKPFLVNRIDRETMLKMVDWPKKPGLTDWRNEEE